MRPLPGMVPVAEFPNRWEAQVVVARLEQAGIHAAMVGDPADQVAPHHVTERMVMVVVREEALDDAMDVLALDGVDDWSEQMDATFHQRRFADRPAWIRYATWALILAIPAPFVVVAAYLLYRIVSGLFP
jgi:hypothetical protein